MMQNGPGGRRSGKLRGKLVVVVVMVEVVCVRVYTRVCLCTHVQRELCRGYPEVTYKVSHISGFEA